MPESAPLAPLHQTDFKLSWQWILTQSLDDPQMVAGFSPDKIFRKKNHGNFWSDNYELQLLYYSDAALRRRIPGLQNKSAWQRKCSSISRPRNKRRRKGGWEYTHTGRVMMEEWRRNGCGESFSCCPLIIERLSSSSSSAAHRTLLVLCCLLSCRRILSSDQVSASQSSFLFFRLLFSPPP